MRLAGCEIKTVCWEVTIWGGGVAECEIWMKEGILEGGGGPWWTVIGWEGRGGGPCWIVIGWGGPCWTVIGWEGNAGGGCCKLTTCWDAGDSTCTTDGCDWVGGRVWIIWGGMFVILVTILGGGKLVFGGGILVFGQGKLVFWGGRLILGGGKLVFGGACISCVWTWDVLVIRRGGATLAWITVTCVCWGNPDCVGCCSGGGGTVICWISGGAWLSWSWKFWGSPAGGGGAEGGNTVGGGTEGDIPGGTADGGSPGGGRVWGADPGGRPGGGPGGKVICCGGPCICGCVWETMICCCGGGDVNIVWGPAPGVITVWTGGGWLTWISSPDCVLLVWMWITASPLGGGPENWTIWGVGWIGDGWNCGGGGVAPRGRVCITWTGAWGTVRTDVLSVCWGNVKIGRDALGTTLSSLFWAGKFSNCPRLNCIGPESWLLLSCLSENPSPIRLSSA